MQTPAHHIPLRLRGLATLYGFLCHVLFITGVAAMIAAMYFGMSRSLGRVAAPWDVVVNALLLIQFPLAHTFLLSPQGRASLARLAPRRIGGHLATTTYAAVASIQILLLFALWTPSGVVWWRAEGTILFAVSCFYAIAWLLLLKAIVDAGFALQTGLLGWWAVARNAMPRYPPMPRTGLFRLSRQPIYVAFALTLWTVPTWTPDQFAVSLTLTAYCLIGPLFKEARFARRFGEEFRAYQTQVPYWLPWPRPRGIMRNDLTIYDAYADEWWSGRVRWLRALHNMVPARLTGFDPLVGDWTGKRVLDLGCGGGFMAEALAQKGALVTGIDLSPGAIAIARKHAEANGLAIGYTEGAGENLAFAGRCFDVVVCVDVLEHVADLDRVIAEIHRVLKPGGLFLFDTINRTRLAAMIMVTFGENILRLLPRGTHDPERFIPPDELDRRLTKAGFTVRPFTGFGPRGITWRLDPVFGRLPTLAVQYMGA
ncbi:MAG: bifunctional 2-polyprenyl-6-hydroxyphenol methylase/3-demethylubiquinol 3-O-methyltransferase UbiG, partial [Parvibaculaceae bacterium]